MDVVLAEVLMRHQEELLALPNVIGVAIGLKSRDGKMTSEPAIIVLVEKKVPLETLAGEETVPLEVSGVLTDVMEVGRIIALEGEEVQQATEYADSSQRRDAIRL